MNNDINLIFGRRKEALGKKMQITQLRIAAGVSLGVIIFSALLLFLLNQVSGIDLLLQTERENTAKIASRQKVIGKLLLLQSRLSDIDTIRTQRPSPDTFIQQITAGLSSDVHIESFILTKKKASLTITSSSLTSLDQFTNYLLAKVNNKELFKTFTMNSVIADPKNQKYILSFDADLL